MNVITCTVLGPDAFATDQWEFGFRLTTPATPTLQIQFNRAERSWILKSYSKCCNVDYEAREYTARFIDKFGMTSDRQDFKMHCTACGLEVPEDRCGSFYSTVPKAWLLRQISEDLNVLEAEMLALEVFAVLQELLAMLAKIDHFFAVWTMEDLLIRIEKELKHIDSLKLPV